MHVHQQIHFGDFRHVTLHIDGVFFRIKTGCKILRENLFYIFMKHLRVGMGGQGMEVRHKIAAIIVILHSDKFAQGSVIVAEMKISGRTDAAQHYFFAVTSRTFFLYVCIAHNFLNFIICRIL